MALESIRDMMAALALASVVSLAASPVLAATLSVFGEGRASARPDMAVVSTGTLSNAKTAQEALSANSKAVSDVIAALKGFGIEPKDIQTSGFSVQPQYSYPTQPSRDPPRLMGYEVRNTVTIRVRDLEKLGPILDASIQSGANEAGGLSFGLSNSDKVEQEARVAAVKDAMAQAQSVAEAAGLKLVRVQSLEVRADGRVGRPMPMLMKADVARSAPVPVEAGETEVSAHATLVYEVEHR